MNIHEEEDAVSPWLRRAQFAAGAVSLASGQKVVGVALMARSAWQAEAAWRARQGDPPLDWSERWERAAHHYRERNEHPLNRGVRVLGSGLVAAGVVGMLLSRPGRAVWGLSAASVGAGLAVNTLSRLIVEEDWGGTYEDPLAAAVGPVDDLRRFLRLRRVVDVVGAPVAPVAQA